MSVKNETVVDDWEDIDDTELDTKVKLLKMHSTPSPTVDSGRPFSMLLMGDDDCLRTPYAPPEPTVKILKRPTNDKNQQLADAKPKAPVKTLQQREQEYAEARLRILGAAKSPDDEEDESAANKNGNAKCETNGFSMDTNRSYTPRTSNTNAVNATRSYGRIFPSPTQPPAASQASQQDLRRIENNVIRLPRAPDGSTGFLLKR